MRKKLFFLFLWAEIIFPFSIHAQNYTKGYEHLFTTEKRYIAPHTDSAIMIDGIASESDWNKAQWTDDFTDIEGEEKPTPLYRTRAKMLWDSHYLYIFAELEEPNIWAYYDEHDQIVYHENDFEIFIDPNRDGYHYFEFEVNAQNTLFDLLLPKPYRNGGKASIGWNATGFKSAVDIEGTLNNPEDTDKKWTVEIAIPFKSIKETNCSITPKNGETWRLNFSRVNWQTSLENGKYTKKKDATGKTLSEFNWVWSPIGIINMHYPERWGLLQFSTGKPGENSLQFQLPKDEYLKQWLWLVYYKQQDYRKKHGEFAPTLQSLNLPEQVTMKDGEPAQLKLRSSSNQFNVTIQTTQTNSISLNEAGYIQIK